MFDCGRAATQKFVKAGLFPTQSDPRFFTHHFDHDVDYPAFLLTRRDKSMGRSESGRPIDSESRPGCPSFRVRTRVLV